ncbi:DUF2934 domain-containing protein [Roseococcus sp. SYP-B2431]|uniref:DUF2934 domain-containing protein n=1 Tax=Roseococcus sp. SYP-B2431 TaxID=2496640 RepID=UPI00103A1345|nr:DUF2934 domain-containing protein [Roseococcus sp. SYP-B2431]TCH99377.1 DUF2934 domain-containing protein [Roseococcus sp. SYP-B2431]
MSDEYELLQQRIRERAYELWEEAGSPEGEEQRFWHAARIDIDQQEAKLDKEVAASFPASDPPSSSVVTGATGESPATEALDETGAPVAKAKPAKRGAK